MCYKLCRWKKEQWPSNILAGLWSWSVSLIVLNRVFHRLKRNVHFSGDSCKSSVSPQNPSVGTRNNYPDDVVSWSFEKQDFLKQETAQKRRCYALRKRSECGKPGHMVKVFCTDSTLEFQRNKGSRTCYKCVEKWHVGRKCTLTPENVEETTLMPTVYMNELKE